MVVCLNRNVGAVFVDSLWELILPDKLFVVFVDWPKSENLGVSLCVVGVLENEAWDDGLDPPNNEFWGDWKSLRNEESLEEDEESLEEELVVGVESNFDVVWAVPTELSFSLSRLTDCCGIPKALSIDAVDGPDENEVLVGCWNSFEVDTTGDLVPFKEKEKLDWTVDGVEEKGVENVVIVDCVVVVIAKTDVVGVFVLLEKENGFISADADIEACSLK